jgi:hypothetical protein
MRNETGLEWIGRAPRPARQLILAEIERLQHECPAGSEVGPTEPCGIIRAAAIVKVRNASVIETRNQLDGLLERIHDVQVRL